MNEPDMNRRRVLKLGSAALLSAGISGRLFAAPANEARFLLVFLRGGYDSTNLMAPFIGCSVDRSAAARAKLTGFCAIVID